MVPLLGIAAFLALLLLVLSRINAVVVELTKWLSHFRPLYKWGRKHYTRTTLEARTGTLFKRLNDDAPFLTDRMKVEWVDPGTSRESFLQNGRIVVRLRFDDRKDQNVVHAASLFVSTSLLFKAKKYLGEAQRDSLDLYVTAKLLEQADDGLVDVFLSEYLLPRTDEDSRVSEYFAAYETLARAGLFFDVLLREVDFLGAKVFGRRSIPDLPPEVDAVIDMLETLALRAWRERVDLTLLREYCRTAVVIVGMQEKVEEGIGAWVGFIEGVLVPRNAESIYLLGMWRNRQMLKEIASRFADRYELIASRRATPIFADGIEREAAIVVLQKHDPSVFQPRTSERRNRLATANGAHQTVDVLARVRSFGDQGYGFLELDTGEGDIFFHLNDCLDPPSFVARGDRVACDLVPDDDEERLRARSVRFLQLAPTQEPRDVLAARARAARDSSQEDAQPNVGASDEPPSRARDLEREDVAPTFEPAPEGRVRAEVCSFGAKQFGFLKMPDGRQAFFHVNDCENPPMNVKVGEAVTCEVYFDRPGRLKAREIRFGASISDESGNGFKSLN